MASISRKKSSKNEVSAKAAGSSAGLADVTIITSFFDCRAAVVHEDIIEGSSSAERSLEIRGLSRHGNFSQMEKCKNIAERVGLVHIVRGNQNGHIEIATEVAQAFPHGMPCDGIEADGWLVQKKHVGAVQHCLGDFETANHSPGVCFHQFAPGCRQSHELKRFIDAAVAVGASHSI